MNRIFLFLFSILTFSATAQIGTVSLSKAIARPSMLSESPIHPANKEELSHTQIMFEYPPMKNAVSYVVTIFKITGENGKDSVPVISQRDSTMATLVDGLEFGQNYSWRYSGYDKNGKELKRSAFFPFHILPLPHNYRLRVVKNESKNQGGLIAFDYAQMIFDRKGNPIWFLAPLANEYGNGDLIRDLRVNKAGTVTFLATKNIFETTVDGKVLWKGPNLNQITKGTEDFYHHGFERLPNGNYMAMGTHHKNISVPGDTAQTKVEYGTLIEFDHSGKLIWSWDSELYLTNADLLENKLPDGKPDTDAHLNAFDVDDSSKYVYAGFRNLNRVVKIEMKTGKVVSSYGSRMGSGEAKYGNGFFWHQHDANLLPDGSIVVYNNDSIADPKISSSVVIFSQPTKEGEESKVLWKFSCRYDTLADGKSEKGGDIELLPNGNFLVNMGTLNRCIELNRKKHIFWDAFVEEWLDKTKSWEPVRQYRAHYSSSLYPCYFTSTAFADTLSKNPNNIKVIVNNEGSESDSYFIDCKFGKEENSPTTTTSIVTAGKSTTTILLQPSDKQKISQIRVRSVTNPDFVRIIKLN